MYFFRGSPQLDYKNVKTVTPHKAEPRLQTTNNFLWWAAGWLQKRPL